MHYFIFSSVAAVGAGLAANMGHVTSQTAINNTPASYAVTIPVAFFLLIPWLFHIRPHRIEAAQAILFPVGTIAVLATSYLPSSILVTGLNTVGIVSCNEIIFHQV